MKKITKMFSGIALSAVMMFSGIAGFAGHDSHEDRYCLTASAVCTSAAQCQHQYMHSYYSTTSYLLQMPGMPRLGYINVTVKHDCQVCYNCGTRRKVIKSVSCKIDALAKLILQGQIVL